MVLSFSVDNYPGSADVILPANNGTAFEARVCLMDAQYRQLFMQVGSYMYYDMIFVVFLAA